MNDTFAIVGIDHVQLAMPAGREDDARGFYSGLLGIPERPKPPELAKRGGVWFENDAVKIHLGIEADYVSDPFGNRLELMEPRSPSGREG